ncbi:hypothetical protein Bpfe_008225 [Biomphalaria pfeifferi]|uniref:WAP domain-containing protein n=1 Tax=Biomphalaria pfeifferi TaxID=112525 RepID=A0AAD8FGR1_BIOPF|nr:hypothetical protein Bpfe_008225 [Biomphalaria pfeifferi]
MKLLSPLVLVSVFYVTSGQFLPLPPQPTPHLPVSSLCHSVRCPHGQHCRVVQSCPHCQPQPVCVSCVPRGVDAVCHRHHFLNAMLHGDHFNHYTVKKTNDVSSFVKNTNDVSSFVKKTNDVSSFVKKTNDVSSFAKNTNDVSSFAKNTNDVSSFFKNTNDVSSFFKNTNDVSSFVKKTNDVSSFVKFLTARRCIPHIPHDCAFDSVCVADGPSLAHGECCYNRVPPGFPIITQHPQCIPNRCLPFCPLGQTCQRVTICPFVPPCYEEYQCRPIFGTLQLGAAAALTLGNE